MDENIISYVEMCRREGTNLQKGMNFGLGKNHTVVLMSLRKNAPYADKLIEDGTVLIYEGHDHPRTQACPNPKTVDQPEFFASGRLTENGKFHKSAQDAMAGLRCPERVRVYEKIHPGIWSYNGIFHLVDSWREQDEHRSVFKFRLIAVAEDEEFSGQPNFNPIRRRVIPTAVKLAVYNRDGGKCVVCGATDELHFDHDLPWSKGGTSLTEANVQLLCARHNLAKHDQII